MYWKQTCINCDMIAPQICFLFRQTDIINRTFVYVHLWGGKETGTQYYLEIIEYFV